MALSGAWPPRCRRISVRRRASVRPIPSPLGVFQRPVRLGIEIEDLRQHRGGDPHPACRGPRRRPRRPSRRAGTADPPALPVYLAALLRRLEKTWAAA